MFSLRVAIIIALSTHFISGRAFGYLVVPFPSSENSEEKISSVTEAPEAPEIETATVSIVENTPRTYGSVWQNLTASGKSSSKGYSCGPENGCYIRHFKQYNYYYPSGQRVSLPIPSPTPFPRGGLFVDSENSVGSSIQMTNDNGRVTIKSSSQPTVSFKLPGVTSYVPNNGFNYVNNPLDSSLRQNVQSYASATTSSLSDEQRTVSEEEQVLSEEGSEEQTNNSAQDDEELNKDVTTYINGPNFYGQRKLKVVNNGNENFQSQYVSVSSNIQSKPSPIITGNEQEEINSISTRTQSQFGQPISVGVRQFGNNQNYQQVSVSSKTQSETKEQSPPLTPPIVNFDPRLGWNNFVNQNRLSYSYNPFFQFHQFGLSTLSTPAAPTPVPAAGPIPAQVPVPLPVPVPLAPYPRPFYGTNPFVSLSPVNTWTNLQMQAPFYDVSDVPPTYSVIL